MLLCRISIFGAFDSLGRKLERPCDNQRERKTDDEKENHKAHDPIRDFEKRKNLAGDLHQQPGDDRVRDSDLVHVTPLQLAEEYLRIHRSKLTCSDLSARVS